MRKVISRPDLSLPELPLPVHIRSVGYNEAEYGWGERADGGRKNFVQVFWCVGGCGELVLEGRKYQEMRERLVPLVEMLGIAHLVRKYPYEVSGGQKQRAAVARALITEPQIILADEPTGALDSKATDSLLELFETVNAMGQTILMVTHSVKAASHASRVLFIKDGEVFHQLYRSGSTQEFYGKITDALTVLTTGGDRP